MLVSTLSLLTGCSPTLDTATNHNNAESNSDHIVGGSLVLRKSEIASSTVAVYDLIQKVICTGSLIEKNIVVTAAHCINPLPGSMVVVFDVNLNTVYQSVSTYQQLLRHPKVRTVQRIQIAPEWADLQNKNLAYSTPNEADIAVIRIAGQAPKGFIPIARLKDTNTLYNGALVTVAGYGRTIGFGDKKNLSNGNSGILRQVEVPIFDANFSSTEISLDQTSGKGACRGDSGGPAFIRIDGRNFLIGIGSRVESDPEQSCTRYSIYTRITSYNSNIDTAINQLK